MPPAAAHRSTRVVVALAGLGAVAALYALYTGDPAQGGFFPPCPLHWATGLSCPGCGTLRATHALLHGDVAAAFALNPLYVVALPFVLAWCAWTALASFGAVRAPPRMPPPAIWALVVVAVVYGVARNLV